ncbi:MAG: EAL domain-containing response regulator [Hyphomonas sp.]
MRHHSALIMDDDPLFQVVAEEALYALGLSEVSMADDGHLGLKMLADSPGKYDLIICDLQMPNIDGVGVMRELGKLKYDGTVVIASSEDRSLIKTVYNMAQMLGIRIAGALKKPLDGDALQALLQSTLHLDETFSQPAVAQDEITRAIRDKAIVPFYQPKVNLRTGSVTGFEVLARLRDAEGQYHTCSPYLQAAEQYGLITDLTLMLLDQVIPEARQLQDQIGPFRLALNLSPTSVGDATLPDLLANTCRDAGFDTSQITLEVTEDRLLERKATVLEVISRLRLAGFKLSVDDFGAGSTSIEQLKIFPFNELKIDRQFVEIAPDDEFSRVTIRSSIALASMLGMTVVAEGIETEEVLNFVIAAGADEGQGYYFSEPLPASAVVGWARKFRLGSPKAA